MPLDLTALRDALVALEKSLGYLSSDLARDPGLREQFRAASIQAFEFTYEVAYKMLKRQLEAMSASPGDLEQMTFMQLVRTGFEAGLVADVGRFQDYRSKRNITSHAYNQAKAEEIVSVLGDFASDVRFLLAELERRNARDGSD
jgi:nucleotidyltransferase substrate binding protein (TIGR01987 family)